MGASSEKNNLSIGQKIRRLRKIRGLSIQQLSEETGMGYSYISGLENDKYSISINNLQRLASYFNIDMIHFLENNFKQTTLVRKQDRNNITTEDGVNFQVITSDDATHMQVSFITLPPNAPTERHIHKHPKGEEFISVIEGEVIVLIEEEKYVLREGDSVIFPSDREHVIYTDSSSAKIILVATPPYGRKFLEEAGAI